MENQKALKNMNNWEIIARNFLQVELKKQGLKYKDLKTKLASIGIEQSVTNIKTKINRGRFQFTFLMQCMKAIGIEKIDLADYFAKLNLDVTPTNEKQK